VEKVFGRISLMTHYIIVVCSKCGGFLLAKAEQKTRTCPYCGSKVALDKARKMASAENAYDASTVLRRLKDSVASKRKHAKSPKQP
jgi:DNA-directed RNA polymerase subunit RPC12/RpoP